MIWNNAILFIHAPKTAGMSMTTLLCQSLEGPINVTGPYEQQHSEGKVTYIPGKRHETLIDAASFLTYRNMCLEQFEKIFVVMRNPYELELSRYAYLKKNLPQDRGMAQNIALEGDFRNYLSKAPFFGMNPPRLDLYYHFNGAMPDNLVILRHERLLLDLELHLALYLEAGYALPRENQSKHKGVNEMYDAEMEALCYDRHRWFFDKAFYPRAFGDSFCGEGASSRATT